jgi:hypothetical protein
MTEQVDWVKESLREKQDTAWEDIVLNCNFVRNFE